MRVGPGTAVVAPAGVDGRKRWCPRCKNGQLFLEGDEAVCLQCGYREDLAARSASADSFGALVVAVQRTAEFLREELQIANERMGVAAEQVDRVDRALTALTGPLPETGRKRGYKWGTEAKARQAERMQARRGREPRLPTAVA